jgi:hypothetical protein
MSHFTPRSSKPLLAMVASLSLFASLAILGCSDNNNAIINPPGGGGSSTFDGTISGPTTSGTLTLTVSTATPAPQPGPARARGTVVATGTLVLAGGGGTVALTGTHDDVNHVIAVSGSGWTFGGGTTGFGLEGTYSGPGGASGVFSCQRRGTGTDTVIVVVGTYAATVGTGSGNFNLSVRGTAIHGNAFDYTGGTPIPLDGTYTPGTGAISIVNPAGGAPLATGTLTGSSASGTWDNSAGDSGTWTGTKQ